MTDQEIRNLKQDQMDIEQAEVWAAELHLELVDGPGEAITARGRERQYAVREVNGELLFQSSAAEVWAYLKGMRKALRRVGLK